jgi:hypothetical protein
MDSRSKKQIDEERAAELLGLTAAEVRRLSVETGLGHTKRESGRERVVFTYAELYRLCRSVVEVAS